LRRTLILLSFVLPITLLFVSCNSSNNSSGGTGSGLKFRAFITQDVFAAGAGVQILDAQNDKRAPVAAIGAGNTPRMMVVTPNRVQTLVFSPSDSRLTLISNGGESASASIVLPGFTESYVVSPDSLTAYIAVPTAPVVGQSPGVVEILNLNNGAFKGQIEIPSARYVALGHSGNRLLVFSDNSDSVNVVSFGTGNPTVTKVNGFDRPVNAFFSGDDNTAYVLNCGAECGGSEASVQVLDLSQNPPVAGAAKMVPAATVGVLDGSILYLAGTPVPASPCTGQTTAATSCGTLTVFDLSSMSYPPPVAITDGYHNRMALGADGQVFVGSHTCTEITAVNTGDEVRGCLSIYNTQNGSVVIPPANGDVTGIEPIGTRHVVYLAQGGELQIYDTTTDKLQKTQLDISGEVVDVKTVDF
jgi:WD40 repeat protein